MICCLYVLKLIRLKFFLNVLNCEKTSLNLSMYLKKISLLKCSSIEGGAAQSSDHYRKGLDPAGEG